MYVILLFESFVILTVTSKCSIDFDRIVIGVNKRNEMSKSGLKISPTCVS